MKIVILLCVVGLLILASCKENQVIPVEESLKCSADIDCVPAECCHAKSCINSNYKKPCDVFCTQQCQPETMDCQQGSCKCIKNQCKAVLKESNSQIANPASVYCKEQGYKLEIRNSPEGQYGVCVFGDGSECEEWAYYNGRCKPGDINEG